MAHNRVVRGAINQYWHSITGTLLVPGTENPDASSHTVHYPI